MKLHGHFEKHKLEVGLSEALPLSYRGPEEKYTLADWLAQSNPTHVHFEKLAFDFTLEYTSDEPFSKNPERMRCYQIISAMPEEALPEVEAELRETYAHYAALAEADARFQLPAPSTQRTANVVDRIRT